MAKVGTKTRWSFAEDRRLIQLAASSKSFKAIADELARPPKSVAGTAKRLGVFLESGAGPKTKNPGRADGLSMRTPSLIDR
jgi:hypothetical protein